MRFAAATPNATTAATVTASPIVAGMREKRITPSVSALLARQASAYDVITTTSFTPLPAAAATTGSIGSIGTLPPSR